MGINVKGINNQMSDTYKICNAKNVAGEKWA